MQGGMRNNAVVDGRDDNFGLYNWDVSKQAWVLLYSGFDPFYDAESVTTGEFLFEIPGSGDSKKGSSQTKFCNSSEVLTMPTVIINGVSPVNFGGALIAVSWRNAMLGKFIGQRSGTIKAVPAPKDSYAVNCGDDVAGKSEAAMHAASRYGMRPHTSQARRKIRIRWANGTEETYENTGTPGTMWMLPVVGTCKAAG